MDAIQELEVVRVAQLSGSTRPVIGSGTSIRQPAVGDIGTVVAVLGGGAMYTVECVNEDGLTDWLCDFERSEIEANRIA
jgi:hypothetical protein